MRAYNRFVTDEETSVVLDGEKDIATLYNLSCGGCMIDLRSAGAVVGSHIELNLRDMVTAQGTIVWRIENYAGVKFETPVHQKIVQMLGYNSTEEGFDAEDPRDRFGLPLFG
ncbi:PilZ domain-containing protein [Qipengyuania sp. CAU 1752]